MSPSPKPEPEEAVTEDVVSEAAEILSAVRKEYLLEVPIENVVSNPWNPNVQDARTYEATRESIREFGFIDPMTVWPHPETEGSFMTLDGEHRHRAAVDEGLTVVDLVVLHDLSPEQARRLTIILNETRGDADVALLGKLFAELDKALDHDMDRLQFGLPYTPSEIENLLKIGAVDWDEFAKQSGGGGSTAAELRQYAVVLAFDKAQRERFDTFTGMLTREMPDTTIEEAVLTALSGACHNL